ncbi:hypothetical protein SAMD00019534_069700, partial [Acytostelium subglobosum LB1]|uniref:hypothetical protein n=1 Tax=Acytostelium subglobosum LB1 TaxID=1410327 RepID=UPI000644E64D
MKLSIFILIITIVIINFNIINSQDILSLPCIIRDHTPQRNPDFEIPDPPSRVITNIVQELLGDNRKPVYCCGDKPCDLFAVHNQTTFNSWFNNVDNVNIPIQMKLELVQNVSSPNVYVYRNDHFFPINGMGWDAPGAEANHVAYKDTSGAVQNYHFCLELHARFTYKGGEVFNFVGDDDVWVFINGKRYIDLGGPHLPASGNFSLDSLGLRKDVDHLFDFFYCERHSTESHIMVSTSMELKCGYLDYCGICEGTGSTCCSANMCDDNDPCTDDSCPPPNTPLPPGASKFDPVTMCVHKQKTCPGSTTCSNAVCNKLSQDFECVNVTKVCDFIPCTVSQCTEEAHGCKYVDLCDPPSTCKTKVGCVVSNSTCIYEYKNCDDGNLCTQDMCDDKVGCQHIQKVCTDNDPCTNDMCNVTTGQCVFQPIPECKPCSDTACVPPNKCTKVECDPLNPGKCITTPLCNDNNACTDDQCNSEGKCTFVSKCVSNDTCFSTSCNETSGQCITKQTMSCDDLNPCTADSCANGKCSNTPIVCDDHNPCTIDKCDAFLGGCQYIPVVCSDQDSCNLGVCNVQTGQCEVKPRICATPNFCITAVCDLGAGGCIQYNKTCIPDNSDCQKGVCDFDKQECQSRNYDPLPFRCQSAGVKAGVAVGAAAIAGIVVGAVVALSLMIFGGKKGYDYWKLNKEAKMTVSSSNPLYTNNPNQGTNPFYGEQ